jgi:hypothetical protein
MRSEIGGGVNILDSNSCVDQKEDFRVIVT